MKLKIQYKPIQDLIPYARNSRTHNDAQVAQIAASIKEFGWTNPVLLDGTNGIIAGHGRVMAAQKLGETEVPTIELSHMDENQKRAYIIADNKLALNAGWDNEMLALEVADLKDAGYDLGLTGFSLDEIAALNGDENIDEDFKEPIDESRNLLMIECQGERELETLYEEMQQRGFECKILS
jgi:ParB-like chromosome segregation protein Spo0J